MAIALMLEFPEGTKEQYDRVLADLGIEKYGTEGLPEGLIFHVAFPGDGVWFSADVWESREDFDRFLRDRLATALERNSISQPKVESFEVYNLLLGKRARVPSGVR